MKLQINAWTYFGRVWCNAGCWIGIDSHVMALAVATSGAVGHGEGYGIGSVGIIVIAWVLGG